VIETLQKEKVDIGSAYKKALSFLERSYLEKKIFMTLPKTENQLSWFEPLCIPALSPHSRKEIIKKYLLHEKPLPVKAIGAFAWSIINLMDQFSDSEKADLERHFSFHEEYFDRKMNKNGLLPAEIQENWQGDGLRTGILIEDQALYAKILDVLQLLTGDQMYNFKKNRLIRAVRENMDGAYILDRKDSLEIRTNNFIAAYFAPELFLRDDWKKTFEAALRTNELWCDWGGLSILSHIESKYETGGQSWFFINNLAATVLYRLDNSKYSQYIDKVMNSSSANVFWQEHSGRPCEVTVSDGGKVQVKGLFGLSLATFIFLYRIKANKNF